MSKAEKECKFIQCEDDMDNVYMCTNCGEDWCFEHYTLQETRHHYCPNCGAKIKEVVELLEED